MLNLNDARAIISLISFFLAYVVAVTPAGAFRSWVAHKMGDDTADELGFTTLNPVMHMDPIGVLFLILANFGWGRYIPVNPFNIHQPYRWLKLFLIYISDVSVYMISAIISLVALISLFGVHVMVIALPMIQGRILFLRTVSLADMYPQSSSLVIALGLILIAYACINVVLAVLQLILNIFGLAVFYIGERRPGAWQYNFFILFGVPMVLILLFADQLNVLVIKTVALIGYVIASLLRMV